MKPRNGLRGNITRHDESWMLTLAGASVGAGILFLPIQTGLGGIWPVLILSGVCFPIIWLSHRTLTHLIVTHKKAPCSLPEVMEENDHNIAGLAISFLYLVFYLTLVIAYGAAMINIAATYIEYQLGLEDIPRPILSLFIALGLSATMLAAGEQTILRITAGIRLPLFAVLLFLSVYLIPQWNLTMLSQRPDAESLGKSLLLILPILVFSLDFSPICAQLAASYRQHYPATLHAMRRSDRVIYRSSFMLLIFVLFFTFSCVLATEPRDLAFALRHNIDVLTLMSLQIKSPLLGDMLPLIAFATLLHSYFWAFLGARSDLVDLMSQWERYQHHPDRRHSLEWISALLLSLPLWSVALANPSILTLIGMVAAPIVALMCYVMPVYLFHRIPRLAIYRERSNMLVLLAGLLVIISYGLGSYL